MCNAAFALDIEAADITKHHVFKLGPNETEVIIEWKFHTRPKAVWCPAQK